MMRGKNDYVPRWKINAFAFARSFDKQRRDDQNSPTKNREDYDYYDNTMVMTMHYTTEGYGKQLSYARFLD